MDTAKQNSLQGKGFDMHNWCMYINSYTDAVGTFNKS